MLSYQYKNTHYKDDRVSWQSITLKNETTQMLDMQYDAYLENANNFDSYFNHWRIWRRVLDIVCSNLVYLCLITINHNK